MLVIIVRAIILITIFYVSLETRPKKWLNMWNKEKIKPPSSTNDKKHFLVMLFNL